MKLLFWDIETKPTLAYVWGLRDQNIAINQIKEPGGVIAVGSMFADEKRATVTSVHKDGYEAMLEHTWQRLDEADAVVSWNGKGFDTKTVFAEFARAGMKPPSPFKEVDLLLAARKKFRLPSMKLQYVSTQLGLEGKVQHTGFQLWIDCMAGDDKAWRLMHKYCRQDVELLRPLHDQLRPWISNYPAVALYDGGDDGVPTCSCGSIELERRGRTTTATAIYQRYRCKDCGSWSRGSKALGRVEVRQIAN